MFAKLYKTSSWFRGFCKSYSIDRHSCFEAIPVSTLRPLLLVWYSHRKRRPTELKLCVARSAKCIELISRNQKTRQDIETTRKNIQHQRHGEARWNAVTTFTCNTIIYPPTTRNCVGDVDCEPLYRCHGDGFVVRL